VKFPATYKSPLVAFRVAPPDATLKLPPIPLFVVGKVKVVPFCIVTLNGIPDPAVVEFPVHSLEIA
jgi:hypothetical protein